MTFPLRQLLAVLALLGLSACIHTPVTLTVAEAFSQGPSVDALPLNPNLRYLRVFAQGRIALMVWAMWTRLILAPLRLGTAVKARCCACSTAA